MRTAILIQARTGSKRLPNKVLLKIRDQPLIVHTINRLKKCRLADGIILSTTDREEDRVLLDIAKERGVEGFSGSERDVLDRFYQAAKHFKIENIVRCTGDCPILDPVVTDEVIRRHFEKRSDYTSNAVIRSFPRGYDTEIIKFSALHSAAENAAQTYEREHVTPYIFEHEDRFKIEHVVAGSDHHWPDLRLTVDTQEDFVLMQELFSRLYDQNPYFGIDEVLRLFRSEPDLTLINAHVKQKTVKSAQ